MPAPRRARRSRAVTLALLALTLALAALVLRPLSAGGTKGASAGCPISPPTGFGPPAWVLGCHIGGQGFTSPVVGTIAGVKVVVDASLSGMVYVVRASDGQEMPGWPQPADLVGGRATAIDSSPALAYLDGPSREPSIVVGLGSQSVKDENGGVMAWNANGSVRFRFRTKKTFSQWGGPARYSNSVFATPAVGDITGSGQQDIVFGSFDHYLYALNPDGRLLPGFPINRADTIWSSPALADTTHSGKMDIIEGGDASGWSGPRHGRPCFSGWISDYREVGGRPRLIWERCLAETVWSSPAVTTFGRTPVVVVGTSFFHGSGRKTEPAEDEVFAFNALTGALLPHWPVQAGGPSFGSPAVGPVKPGGPVEVVDSSCADCLSGPAIVSAWNEGGKRLWRTDLTLHGEVLASPALADVTNFPSASSTTNDVLIGNDGGLYVLDAATGKKVAGTGSEAINASCNVGGTPAVSAVPGSRSGYMLFTNCGYNGPSRAADEYLRGYDIPPPSSPAPWPMFRANPQRTGVPDPFPVPGRACAAPGGGAGYRVVTAAGRVSSLGSAHSCGDLSDALLPDDVVGIVDTSDGAGYWIALADGTVYAFGDARDLGDLRGEAWARGPNAPGPPVVAMAASRGGYLLLAGDGSVYAFGGASYHGSDDATAGKGTPVGIASDSESGGYWIATSSGHVFGFDAPSEAGPVVRGRVVGIAPAPEGSGYWLVTASGSVSAFGSARFEGSHHGGGIVAITASGGDSGYYLLSSTGKVYDFGSARAVASSRKGGGPAVAIASS